MGHLLVPSTAHTSTHQTLTSAPPGGAPSAPPGQHHLLWTLTPCVPLKSSGPVSLHWHVGVQLQFCLHHNTVQVHVASSLVMWPQLEEVLTSVRCKGPLRPSLTWMLRTVTESLRCTSTSNEQKKIHLRCSWNQKCVSGYQQGERPEHQDVHVWPFHLRSTRTMKWLWGLLYKHTDWLWPVTRWCDRKDRLPASCFPLCTPWAPQYSWKSPESRNVPPETFSCPPRASTHHQQSRLLQSLAIFYLMQ